MCTKERIYSPGQRQDYLIRGFYVSSLSCASAEALYPPN